jgi:long-chain acyl-CoA synthetase
VLLTHGLDARVLARQLTDGGATILPTVPSVLEILADSLDPNLKMPDLRRVYSAGGPLPRAVYERFRTRFGRRVSQLYGATEVGSVTFADPDDVHFDATSVGRPMHGVSVRVVDPLDPSRQFGHGEEGHIAIRADSMFDGYIADDEPPPIVDGHFLTGDLGRSDERGRLTITGRLKLLIEVGGLKVNPVEVESVLAEHPAVGRCVVVPVRQSQTVFRIKAVVTPRDPSRPPVVEELRALARQKLATYKVPRMFEIRDELPTTPTGKVLRHLVESA